MSRTRPRVLPFLCAASLLLAGVALPDEADARRRRPRPAARALAYELELATIPHDELDVSLRVQDPRGKRTKVAMPAWTPGSYLVRDFARKVFAVRATTDDGAALNVRRLDKQTWEIEHGGRDFTVSYRVQADELSVRTSYADDQLAVINGASVFMYVVDAPDAPATVKVAAGPLGPVHTALPEQNGLLQARDYDQLVDAPMTAGPATVRTFEVSGVRFEYVLHAPEGTNADIDRLVKEARAVVEAAGALMGGFPFKRYVFHSVCDRAGGGGLEHDDSTVMILRPWSFGSDAGYRRAAALLAHEFFHAWNVKRIRDRVLGPFDYAAENYTDLLWFHEGFTETVEARLLLSAGLATPDEYMQDLARTYARYLARPGKDARPMSEISQVAWIEGYKPSPHHHNTSISYYLKGGLIGVALDLTLRQRSLANGRPPASVETLFQRLWSLRDEDQRVSIDLALIVEIASSLAGEDMRPFFDRHVTGTTPLPLPTLLASSGVRAVDGEIPAPDLGINTNQLRVRTVDRDGPAAAAGVAVGDQLIALDAHHLDSDARLTTLVTAASPATSMMLTLARRGRIIRLPITVRQREAAPATFERAPDAAGDAALLQTWWLDGAVPASGGARP